MKTTVSLLVLAGTLLAAGCATTGSTTETTSANTITLEQALQQAQTTRQQLQEAKEAYQNVKAAAQASKQNGTNIETELAKQVVQTKIDNTKQQINNEIQDWKNLLAD